MPPAPLASRGLDQRRSLARSRRELLDLIERYPERMLGAMFLVTRAAADDAAGNKTVLYSPRERK